MMLSRIVRSGFWSLLWFRVVFKKGVVSVVMRFVYLVMEVIVVCFVVFVVFVVFFLLSFLSFLLVNMFVLIIFWVK